MKQKQWILMIVYFLISLGNIVTVGKTSNLLISMPQYIIVLLFLFNGKTSTALLLHQSFIITCISSTNVAALLDDPLAIYSYSRIKLVGPIGVSYLISILIFLFSINNYKKIDRSTLFYKLFKTISILGSSGYLVGAMGLLIDSYYTFDTFVFYGVYIFIVWINIFSLLLNSSDILLKKYYSLAVILIISGVFASFVGYAVFGIVNVYGNLEIILQSDIVYFAPLLIAGLMNKDNRFLSIVAIGLYLFMSLQSINGKGIVITILGVVCLLSNVLLFPNKALTRKKLRRSRIAAIILIGAGVVLGFSFDFGLMFLNKFHQLTSIFSGSLDTIDESPYIRVATTLNILDNYSSHPLRFIFGMGYGGYFTDSLSLFGGLDLTTGGWAEEVVKSGHFNMGHDTFASVPLFNGFIGLFLLFKIVYIYVKRIRYNMCAFAAIPWLFLTFYFNTQLAISGIILLYASEYRNEKKTSKK